VSLALVQRHAEQLAGWRADVDAGKELDQAAAQVRSAVLEDLRRLVREQRRPGVPGDPIIAAAAERAIVFDDEERRRIRAAHQIKATVAQDAVKAAWAAGRPQRWAALPPPVRAAYRAAEVVPAAVRRGFLVFAEALLSELSYIGKAGEVCHELPGAPSALFETENDPAMQAEVQAEAHARYSAGLRG
jgi:hypothetical protein